MVVTRVSRLWVEYPSFRNARKRLTTLMIDCIYRINALGMAGTCNVSIVVEFHPRLLVLILKRMISASAVISSHLQDLFRLP
jgi:hypothetical protein